MAVDEMVAFINARLDEVEHDAREAIGTATFQQQTERAVHITRHDPARVLADVAARREMVTGLHAAIGNAWQWGEEAREVVAQLAVLMLQRLAALDSDHPDYDTGWQV